MEEKIAEGTPVVATYGHNKVLNKPFEFLYKFGYYSVYGCIVYIVSKRNSQDSYAFKLDQIRIADEKDLKCIPWGS